MSTSTPLQSRQLGPDGPSVFPIALGCMGMSGIIGARTRAQLAESLGALQVSLSPDDLACIEAAVPPSAVAGTRYDEHQMRMLDSER